ncbi:hypothetical protein [Solibacillus cecembensis]|uniref:hypothetical protein n=1 Tax=Solibacillus cecembensis TaxID=459347 RepID=UPI003D00FD99
MRQNKEQTIYDYPFRTWFDYDWFRIFIFVAGGFPTEHENETAQYCMNTMEATGYLIPMLAIVKIICRLSFIAKRLMPFSLIIFMSLSVNLVMFHLFLEPFTGFPSNFIFLMNVVLMVKHLLDYRNLLQAKKVA